MPRWLNVPNLLTLCRLVLAPFIMHALVTGAHLRALVLFAVAAASDGADGYFARRFHSITRTGAYLDPIADKTLLSGIYLALAAVGQIPLWFVAVVFGRDLLILGFAGFAMWWKGQRKFPPSVWGKLSTFFQVVTAVAILARNVLPSPQLAAVAGALIWPAAAATIWSGLHYGWRGWRLLRMD